MRSTVFGKLLPVSRGVEKLFSGASARSSRRRIAAVKPWLPLGEALEKRLLFTTVPGQTITTSTTWTAANSPYNLTGNVSVANSATLNIQPGVVVTGSSLVIESGGNLSASSANFSSPVIVQSGATGSAIGSTFGSNAEFDATSLTLGTDAFLSTVSVFPTFVPNLTAAGDSFAAGTAVNLLGQTVSSSLTLPAIANVSSYSLNANVYIGSGGGLTIAGSMNIGGTGTLVVNFGGSIGATNDTFTTALDVRAGATGGVTGSTFDSTTEFDTGAVSFSTDTFNSTVTILPTSVPTLLGNGNVLVAGSSVGLLGSTLNSALTLPTNTNVSGYVLVGDVIVGSGGNLTVANNAVILGSTLTVSTGGALSSSGGDFQSPVDALVGSIVNITGSTFDNTAEFDGSPTLTTDTFNSSVTVQPIYVPTLAGGGNTFNAITVNLIGATVNGALTLPLTNGISNYNLADNVYFGNGGALTIASGVVMSGATLVIGSGASLTASDVTFEGPVDVRSGSTGNVSGSTFASTAEFDATSIVLGTDIFESTVTTVPTFLNFLPINGNTFTGNTAVNILSSTINTALALPVINGVTSYNLQGNFYIGSGGTLNISNGLLITGSTLSIESGGMITAPNVTFDCPLTAESGSAGNVSNSALYGITEFDASAVIINADSFAASVSVYPTYAANLGLNGNAFPGSPVISLLGSTITASADLPSINGVVNYNLTGNLNIGENAALAIDSGVELTGNTITVESGGAIQSVADTFYSNLTLGPGSSNLLEYDTFESSLTVDGQITGTSIIKNNDFSSPTASVFSQGIDGPINLTGNWWGTTSVPAINNKIFDKNDNPSLPLVDYQPVLTSQIVVPKLLASISVPRVTTGNTDEVITVVYSDAYSPIQTGEISSANLIVKSATGAVLTVTENSSTNEGNKTAVTYMVTPPNGINWVPIDNGTGSVMLNADVNVFDAAGDAAFSPTVPLVVSVPGNAASLTSLNSSASAVNFGNDVTFTATVTGSTAGAAVPTGTVDFLLSGVLIGTANLGTTGTAVFATTTLEGGSNSVVAQYQGDNSYASSQSAAVLVTVNVVLTPATTTLAVSASTITAATPITLTATVTPGVGGTVTPTGTVNFLQNGLTIGTGTLDFTGTAALTTSALLPGTDAIIASYAGDGVYAAGQSVATSVLATSGTTTVLTVSQTLIFAGDSVKLTATVTPAVAGGSALVGTINFLGNLNVSLGSATLANGIASIITTGLTAGTDSLTAVFVGQSPYSGSTAPIVVQPVSPPPNSAISVNSSAGALTEVTNPVTFNVQVSSLIGGAVPTGTVTLTEGATILGTALLSANGIASFTTTNLLLGGNTVTASYSGDATYTQARPTTSSLYLYQLGPVPTSVTGTLSPVIAGVVSPGSLNVTLTNPTVGNLLAQGAIDIYASLSGVFDTNSVLVQSTYVDFRVLAGKTQALKVLVSPLPPKLATGNYTLIAACSTPFGLFNYATMGPKVAVTAQVHSLPGTVLPQNLPSPAVSGNKTSTRLALSFTNDGNVAVSGKTTFDVSLSTAAGVPGTAIVTYVRNVKVPTGASGNFALPVKQFPTLAGGTYFFVVQMTDALGNTFVYSSPAITIQARTITLAASFGGGSFLSPSGLIITLTNNGNVDDISSFEAIAGYALDAAGAQPLAGRTATVITRRYVLRHGKSIALRLKQWASLSPNVVAGTRYYATITFVDSAGNQVFAVDPVFQIAV